MAKTFMTDSGDKEDVRSDLRVKVIDAVCFKSGITGHLEQFERIEALIAAQLADQKQRFVEAVEAVKYDIVRSGGIKIIDHNYHDMMKILDNYKHEILAQLNKEGS